MCYYYYTRVLPYSRSLRINVCYSHKTCLRQAGTHRNVNLLSETSADVSGIQQARPAVQTSDNELLFSSLPSVLQVLSHITGIIATIM